MLLVALNVGMKKGPGFPDPFYRLIVFRILLFGDLIPQKVSIFSPKQSK